MRFFFKCFSLPKSSRTCRVYGVICLGTHNIRKPILFTRYKPHGKFYYWNFTKRQKKMKCLYTRCSRPNAMCAVRGYIYLYMYHTSTCGRIAG